MNEKRTETLKKLLRKINHECHICGTKSETCYLSTKDYFYSCKKHEGLVKDLAEASEVE